jgi:RecB family exonuclease
MISTTKQNKSTDYKTRTKKSKNKHSKINQLPFKILGLILARGTKASIKF